MEELFNNKIMEERAVVKSNSVCLSEVKYREKINQVLSVKLKKKKEPYDYKILKKFDVLAVDDVLKLIVPLQEGSEIKYYVHDDELYDILYKVHISIGHGGRDRMIREVKRKFKNVTYKDVALFLNLCEPCQQKQKSRKKEIVVNPLLCSLKIGLSKILQKENVNEETELERVIETSTTATELLHETVCKQDIDVLEDTEEIENDILEDVADTENRENHEPHEINDPKCFALSTMQFLHEKDEPQTAIKTEVTNVDIEETQYSEGDLIKMESPTSYDPLASPEPLKKKAKTMLTKQIEAPWLEELIKIMKDSPSKDPPPDSFSVYGQHIANKLRNYSKNTQIEVEHAFNNILFQADRGLYNCPAQPNHVYISAPNFSPIKYTAVPPTSPAISTTSTLFSTSACSTSHTS